MKRIKPIDVALFVVSLAFFLGSLFLFDPCGPKDDGSWMRCHWAGTALSGAAAVLTAISLVRIFLVDSGIRLGLSISLIPVAVYSALIPGTLIGLCMMNTMKCHTATRPAAIVFSAVIIILSVLDVIFTVRNSKKA